MFEIGNSLREARVRQSLEYPQVELATKIRAKYVKALEEEQFGVLPAQPYVKGFLRTYAEFLGLDGQLYVDEYNSRFVSDGFDEPCAASLAIMCIASLEGAVVLCRSTRSVDPLHDVAEQVEFLIKSREFVRRHGLPTPP